MTAAVALAAYRERSPRKPQGLLLMFAVGSSAVFFGTDADAVASVFPVEKDTSLGLPSVRLPLGDYLASEHSLLERGHSVEHVST